MTVVSRGYTPKSNPSSLFPSARSTNTVGQSSSMSSQSRRAAQVSARERHEKELAALMMVAEQRRIMAEAQEEQRRREEEQRQKALARQRLRQQKKLAFVAAAKIQRVARRYLARRKQASADVLRLWLEAEKRRMGVRRLAKACRGVRKALARFTVKRRERLLLEAQRLEVAQQFASNVISHCIEKKSSLLWNIKLHIFALKVQTKFRAFMRKKKLQRRMRKLLTAATFVGRLRRSIASSTSTDNIATKDETTPILSGRKKLASARSDPALSTRPRSRASGRTHRTSRSSMSAAVDAQMSEMQRLELEDPEKFKRIQELHQQQQSLSELELERRRQKILQHKARAMEKAQAAELAQMEEALKRERNKEVFMQELLDTRLREARRFAKAQAIREKQQQERQAQAAELAAREQEERNLMAKEELVIRMIIREKKLAALRARRALMEQQARETEAELQAERQQRMQELKDYGQRASQQRLHDVLAKEAQVREEAALKAKDDAERVAKFHESFNEIRRKQIEQLRKRKEAQEREIAALLEAEGEQSVTLELELQKIKVDHERAQAAVSDKENQVVPGVRRGSAASVKMRSSALAQHDLQAQKLPRNLAPALWSSPYIVSHGQKSQHNLTPPPVRKTSVVDAKRQQIHRDGNEEREPNDCRAVEDETDDTDDYYDMVGGGLNKMASILAMVRKARTALDISENGQGSSSTPPFVVRSGQLPPPRAPPPQQRGQSQTAAPASLPGRFSSSSAPCQLEGTERQPTPQQLAYQHLLDVALAPSPDRHVEQQSPTLNWRDDDRHGPRPETGGGYTDEEFEDDFEDEDLEEHAALEPLKAQPNLHVTNVQFHQPASPVRASQARNSAVSTSINIGSLDALLAQTVDEYFGEDNTASER